MDWMQTDPWPLRPAYMAPWATGRRDRAGEPSPPLPGSYAICPICFWEDDAIQLRWPTRAGGANKVSVDAQRNYRAFGACDQPGRRFVRPPAEDEPLDPAWRPIDLAQDSFETWGSDQAVS